MQPTGCLNCGGVLLPQQHFCPACGQKSDTPRISFKYLFQEFIQAFAHTEKGIWRLLKGLALHPGKTATEYVEGKRKTYFNPIGFLGLCIAFMILVHNWFRPYPPPPVPDPAVIARIPDTEIKEAYLKTVDRIATVVSIGNKNLKVISVLVAPWFAVGMWMFFRNRGRNIAEITVAYILFTAFGNVLSTIFVSPILAALRDSNIYFTVFWISIFLQTVYYSWGLTTFFRYRSVGEFIKVFLALFLVGTIGFILLMTALFIYAYHDAFQVFPYL